MSTEDSPFFRDERHAWRYLRRDTKPAAKRRAWGDSRFIDLFPEGHKTSIRDFVELYADKAVCRDYNIGIDCIHPDAYDLLLRYGTDFVPHVFEDRAYTDSFQPKPGQCFCNAWLLMEVSQDMREKVSFCYVEGVVIGSFTQPMLHAWNTASTEPTFGYDWSHYATTGWARYFGITFNKEEYDEIQAQSGRGSAVSLLFHRNHFKVIEKALRTVLSRRNEKPAA